MKKPKKFYDLAVCGCLLAINILAYFIFPALFLPSGKLGMADGYLILADILLLPVCLYKKLWASSVICAIGVAVYIHLSMLA